MYEDQRSKIEEQNNCQIPVANIQSKYNLRDRPLAFAKRILQICRTLPKIPECDGIRKQLANAGTSVGANYEEADGALTKKDFVNKVGISRKEAKETRFWLKVIDGSLIDKGMMSSDIRESEEIICILSAIIKKTGNKAWL